MQVIQTIQELRKVRAEMNGSVGFIPTMGALHQGHLALVKQALEENDHAIISIFVNPKQFGPHEDFAKYPRTLDSDLELLSQIAPDVVFAPNVDEMYPENFQTSVEVKHIAKVLEGERRPDMFSGVATVVTKLFNIVQPDRAYFGQKDAQQVLVVQQMVNDLAMPLKIVVVPTLRASDGLALSSRNVYLNKEERLAAPILFKALTKAKEAYQNGEHSAEKLRQTIREVLNSEPLMVIDYISVANAETLVEIDEQIEASVLFSLAVRIGKTRLIDNILLT